MKNVVIAAISIIVIFAIANVRALDPAGLPSHEGSSDLQRIKALQGTWAGTMDMGEGPKEIEVQYDVTAGGSVVVETLHPDQPHEMVSMYHDVAGELNMVHYCMLGNQPHMSLQESTENSVALAMDGMDSISDPNEAHMHALTITFVDEGTIDHAWTHYENGESTSVHKFTLKRTE